MATRAVAAAVVAAAAAASAGAAAGKLTATWGGDAVRPGVAGGVGATGLVELRSLSRATGARILVKLEHLNPTGSVKDRAAKMMLDAAELRGELVPAAKGGPPGQVVVEATGGNTGISLALLAKERGYGTVLAMPKSISREKVDAMRMFGAEVLLTPGGVSFQDSRHYYQTAKRRAEEVRAKGGKAVFLNQFDNEANFQAHYSGTGPELFAQTAGKIDGFVSGAGKGGTIAGTSAFLKERNPDVQIYLADCPGSGLKSYVERGTFEAAGSTRIQEGIGITRLTKNFERAKVDRAFLVEDDEARAMACYLLRHEGLFVGPSAALNVVGAVKAARELGEGKVIATVVCDGGDRYRGGFWHEKTCKACESCTAASGDLAFVR